MGVYSLAGERVGFSGLGTCGRGFLEGSMLVQHAAMERSQNMEMQFGVSQS